MWPAHKRSAALLLLTFAAAAGCDDPPGPGPFRARLTITVGTTGEDVDRDNLRVRLDDGPPRVVPDTGAVRFDQIEPGEHTVEVTGIAANCTFVGNNPFTIELRAGQARQLHLLVQCELRTGTVRVVTTTSGIEPDANGYQLIIAGEPVAVAAGDQVTHWNLHEGEHGVTIAGVARNCEVAGSETRIITVAYRDTNDVTFSVECQQSATLEVEVVATGSDPDADGYEVHLGGVGRDTAATVAPNEIATFAGLMPGEYELVLRGVAVNCDVVETQPTAVALTAGGVTRVTASVACAPIGRIAFVSLRDGNPEIYTMRTDGTALTRLTSQAAVDEQPAWSRDGSRIAFTSHRDGNADIYVLNADGSNLLRLTSSSAAESEPAWSPDGSRIAFTSERFGNSDVYVMNADGSNAVQLTNRDGWDGDPAWSPDGARIAFSSDREDRPAIFLMDPDGANVTRLTTGAADLTNDFDPDWSPDGTRIAFARLSCGYYYYNCEEGITVVGADGSAPAVISAAPGSHGSPSWSPDGRKIVFATLSYDYYDCYYYCYTLTVVRLDGTDVFTLVGADAYDPAWRPE